MSDRTKVDTAALASRAQEINTIQREVTSVMEEIKVKITSLRSTWESTEAENYQAKFGRAQDSVAAVLNMITVRANSIVRAADAYNVSFREVAVNIDEIPSTSGVQPLS
jgi:WXG100 family type VII secretion target